MTQYSQSRYAYSSLEIDNRAKNLASLLQAKLAGIDIKSEVSDNWYSYTLMVETPEIYQAISIPESADEGCLMICFETIRSGTDSEILYPGINIEEPAFSFDEVFDEAKRQNDWVKRRVERQAQVNQEHQRAMGALNRVQTAHPGYKIHLTSESDCHFGIYLEGLTETRLQEVIRSLESIG